MVTKIDSEVVERMGAFIWGLPVHVLLPESLKLFNEVVWDE